MQPTTRGLVRANFLDTTLDPLFSERAKTAGGSNLSLAVIDCCSAERYNAVEQCVGKLSYSLSRRKRSAESGEQTYPAPKSRMGSDRKLRSQFLAFRKYTGRQPAPPSSPRTSYAPPIQPVVHTRKERESDYCLTVGRLTYPPIARLIANSRKRSTNTPRVNIKIVCSRIDPV